jgi:hypothetical protein
MCSGRDPGLWQALDQQIAQVTRVAAIGLRAPLRAAGRRRLAGSASCTSAPARRQTPQQRTATPSRLDGRLDLHSRPALQERPKRDAISGRNPIRS